SFIVIFCHGLGDTGHGWADVMEMIGEHNQHIKFILPNAPIQPVTINGGYRMNSWYDIKTLSERGTEDKDDVEKSRAIIEEIIKSEVDAGIPSERIILGGFSQGAALSLYTFYHSQHKMAGCMALSGYLPLRASFSSLGPNIVNKQQPLIMFHGEEDQVVRYSWGQLSFETLQTEVGVNGEFITYPFMGHSSSEQEIIDMTAFVKKRLP
ncbi:hypothetical protein SAMD00019534_007840, partial [Acytostelium subglobosum LB1]|uniref:hypothetical protein n=1 Tax=Acytostelium subglobosum LB1 TaxID=1410327 RepID=UPI000644960F